MTHVRTSPYDPQSNGKLERYHKSIKGECIRVKTSLSLEEAQSSLAEFVRRYNTERLHSAIGYITPLAQFEGRADMIQAAREAKLTGPVIPTIKTRKPRPPRGVPNERKP